MKIFAFILSMQAVLSNADQLCATSNTTTLTPTTQFVIHGDGTTTHIETGLMWKVCSEGLDGIVCDDGAASTMTWSEALQSVVNNNVQGYAGYGDWRLPTITELVTITELQCFRPAINLTVFPRTSNSFYWASTPSANNDDSTWFVDFVSGATGNENRTASYAVRLVRSGRNF